jgi:hypothetical protein
MTTNAEQEIRLLLEGRANRAGRSKEQRNSACRFSAPRRQSIKDRLQLAGLNRNRNLHL